jgi:hypothetical protein
MALKTHMVPAGRHRQQVPLMAGKIVRHIMLFYVGDSIVDGELAVIKADAKII